MRGVRLRIFYYNQATPGVLHYISNDIAGLSSTFHSCSKYREENRDSLATLPLLTCDEMVSSWSPLSCHTWYSPGSAAPLTYDRMIPFSWPPCTTLACERWYHPAPFCLVTEWHRPAALHPYQYVHLERTRIASSLFTHSVLRNSLTLIIGRPENASSGIFPDPNCQGNLYFCISKMWDFQMWD